MKAPCVVPHTGYRYAIHGCPTIQGTGKRLVQPANRWLGHVRVRVRACVCVRECGATPTEHERL